jgi:hypothetical protein
MRTDGEGFMEHSLVDSVLVIGIQLVQVKALHQEISKVPELKKLHSHR